MFGDFTTLIVDQVIQHLSKFTTMYGNKIDIPTLIRTPMGGRRGYGPTHSQSLERLFFGTQGVNLFSANHRSNLQKLLDENLSKKEPAILFENKLNYQLKNHDYLNTNYEKKVTNDKSATVIISPINKKANYTIFCYGYTLKIAEDILDELEKMKFLLRLYVQL